MMEAKRGNYPSLLHLEEWIMPQILWGKFPYARRLILQPPYKDLLRFYAELWYDPYASTIINEEN
jgi:hypothetical protein